ncbi:MAG: hypothetical protein J7L23_02460 [Candidatus Diapherotrites archaeon]|nr:hypothetical protein [Candidatus Diapherotrites archaeon]
MKEKTKMVISIFLVFLATQLLGLYLAAKYISIEQVQPVEEASFSLILFAYIIVTTAIVLIVIKYIKRTLKLLEAFVIFFSSFVFFELLFLGLIPDAYIDAIAVTLALGLVILRKFNREYWTQDLAFTVSIIGAGALLGAMVGFLPAITLIAIITVYDVIAVFWTKHMVVMAKEIVKQKLAFTMAIPTKEHVYQLGGGDLALPLVLNVSILRSFGLISALSAICGSMLGLALLFAYLSTHAKRPLPAMPAATAGALVGLAVGLLLK